METTWNMMEATSYLLDSLRWWHWTFVPTYVLHLACGPQDHLPGVSCNIFLSLPEEVTLHLQICTRNQESSTVHAGTLWAPGAKLQIVSLTRWLLGSDCGTVQITQRSHCRSRLSLPTGKYKPYVWESFSKPVTYKDCIYWYKSVEPEKFNLEFLHKLYFCTCQQWS